MKSMYLICNAHIDPMWQWEWQEGAGAALSTFRVAAELCEQYDTFLFNHNEALLYQWIEQYEPELFVRIQKLVQAGRWHIMGGWYLQPDCNMPGGESFLMQIEEGRRYFEEKFGVRPSCAINFDSFGHSRGLVQILNKCGYDSYLITRPAACIPALPDERFTWEGFAGSSVRVVRMPAYNTPLGQSVLRIADEMKRQEDRENGLILWGVGDHGGGPSRKDLDDITNLISRSGDVRILHSTPEQFFEAIRGEELPVYNQSLRPVMVGCYVSQIRIKQLHRKLENDLFMAEKIASAASAAGLMEYPADELMRARKSLMFAQFHDILPGSSTLPVEDAGISLLSHGLEETGKIKTKAFFRLCAGQKKAGDGELPILVYHYHPFRAEADITCEMMLPDQNYSDEFINLNVYDSMGNLLPSQVEKEESNLPIQWRKRVTFHAKLEPFSMNRFHAFPETLETNPRPDVKPDGDIITLQGANAVFRMNRKTGLIEEYTVNGRACLKAGSGMLRLFKDSEDPWGMNVTGYQEPDGTFTLADPDCCARICGVHSGTLEPVHIIENGDVRTAIEVIQSFGSSYAVLRYWFSKLTGRLKLTVRIQFTESERLVKYCLLPAFPVKELLGKTAFGVEPHPLDGRESIAGEYLICHDGDFALSAANDGSYAFSCTEEELKLTLLHTSAYCAHPIGDRIILPQDRYSPRMDQGPRQFTFEFFGSPVEERIGQVQSEADQLNQPLQPICYFPPEGGRNGLKPDSFVVIDTPCVQLSACRTAPDGRLVLHLFNSSLSEVTAQIGLPSFGIGQDLHFLPLEVKNCLVNDGGLSEEESFMD